jgi:hypothetical protein
MQKRAMSYPDQSTQTVPDSNELPGSAVAYGVLASFTGTQQAALVEFYSNEMSESEIISRYGLSKEHFRALRREARRRFALGLAEERVSDRTEHAPGC